MPRRLPDGLLSQVEDRIRKAARFRDAAEGALGAGDYETTVSRAYYAAYHGAVAFLMANGNPEAEAWRSHARVISQCVSLGTKRNTWLRGVTMPQKDFSDSLNTLYNWREEADYSVQTIPRDRARRALDFVKEFLIAANDRIP